MKLVRILFAVVAIVGLPLWANLPVIVDYAKLSACELMTISGFPGAENVLIGVPKEARPETRTFDGYEVKSWRWKAESDLVSSDRLSFISITVRSMGMAYWESHLQQLGKKYQALHEIHGGNNFYRLKVENGADYYFLVRPPNGFVVKIEGFPGSGLTLSAYEAFIDRILASVNSY